MPNQPAIIEQRRNRKPTKRELPGWHPPAGWIQRASGVWEPADYQPTRWEIPAPTITTVQQAENDWLKCKKWLAYFAFAHCWTLDTDDPLAPSTVRKVPAYDYLLKFFNAVQEPSNTHCEKSRQMLLSWAWMVVFLHDVLFHQNWHALVLSKRSKDVDDGGAESTPNSNLGKIRFIHAHLPEHLFAHIEFKKFMIRVPSTRSTITGETGKGGMAARGPTYNRALMDEAAYVEHSETVFTGLRQASKTGTALNSTPNGMQNTFARIRHSTTTTFQKLSFHWSEHPRKSIGLYCICGWKAKPGLGLSPRDQYLAHAAVCPRLSMDPPRKPEMRSPWYDRETSDMTPDKVAKDLDISYRGSQKGRVYYSFDQTRNVWEVFHRLGPREVDETIEDYRQRYLSLVIDPMLPSFVTFDIGVGDATALLFGQIVDDAVPRVRFLDEYENSDQSYEHYADFIKGVWLPALERSGSPLSIAYYGGFDVKSRWGNLESWFSNLKVLGIHVQTGDRKDQSGMLEWLDYINALYRLGHIEISEWCAGLIDAVENYHYPIDKNTGEPIPGMHLPEHDENSHKMDSKRYLFKVRYAEKLRDRLNVGVPRKNILARGRGINPRTETRQF